MYGLTFNDRHSNDFGLVMLSKNRPILPEPKIVVEEIPCRDGEIDFSEANPEGRTLYKPRNMEIEFSFVEKDLQMLRVRAHKIASWLACGEKQLIFDDEKALFYLARIANKLDFENQMIRARRFTAQFKARPFAFSRQNAEQQRMFDGTWMFGYNYRFDTQPTVFSITGSTSLNIYNPGMYAKPLIRIAGTWSNITFTHNGKSIICPGMTGQLEVDCDLMTAVYNGTVNVLNNIGGTGFIEFVNGNNTLQITGSGLNCTVSLIFKYLYL